MARVLTFQASTSRQIRHTVSHEPQTPYLRRFPFRVVAMQITAADPPLKKWQPGKGWGWCCAGHRGKFARGSRRVMSWRETALLKTPQLHYTPLFVSGVSVAWGAELRLAIFGSW
jgi:hypothetical protein